MRRPATEKLGGDQVSRMQRHFVAIVTGVFVMLILWTAAVPLTSWFELNRRVDALQTAAQRWRQNGYPEYAYRVSVECNCEYRTGSAIRIDVSEIRVEADKTLPVRTFPVTIDETFDFIGSLLDRHPDVLEADYHELYGYPLRIVADFDDAVQGDEIVLVVSQFEPAGGRP